MAIQTFPNVTAATYGAFWLAFVSNFLKTKLGFTHAGSGDGIAVFHNSGQSDLFTTTGAGFIANAKAYWIGQQPPGFAGPFAGTRQICFQFNGENNQIRVTFALEGFAAPSAASQQPDPTGPSAQRTFYGGGSNATPTFETIGDPNISRIQMVGQDASPGGFLCALYPSGGGDVHTVLMMDPMIDYATLDSDPYVYYFRGGDTSTLAITMTRPSSDGPKALMDTNFEQVGALVYSEYDVNVSVLDNVVVPRYAGTNPFSNDDNGLPLIFARRGTLGGVTGIKGQSTMLRWASALRSTGDTFLSQTKLVLASATNFVAYTLWDGTTTPDV